MYSPCAHVTFSHPITSSYSDVITITSRLIRNSVAIAVDNMLTMSRSGKYLVDFVVINNVNGESSAALYQQLYVALKFV